MIKPKKAPYANSTVDADKTSGAIDKLLREYGCSAVNWTKDFDRNKIELRFIVGIEIDEQPRQLGILLRPPLFVEKRRTWDAKLGRYIVTEAPNYSQSMRLLYHYLKNKLAAVAWGVSRFEEEFLSDIITRDEFGNELRVIDMIKDKQPGMIGLPDKSHQAPIYISNRTEQGGNSEK